MNRKERTELAGIIAEWEWRQDGSSSEAAARSACARDLLSSFLIDEDDLLFARTWEIAGRMGIRNDVDLLDALDDLIGGNGYEAVCDTIEDVGFDGLRLALQSSKGETK